MTILADAAEVQPEAFVTVMVYVPVTIPDIVVVVPVPEVVIPEGMLVIVHVPVVGKPFKSTLPVATAHIGWMIVPDVGAAGVAG